jgi:hypothetical protein
MRVHCTRQIIADLGWKEKKKRKCKEKENIIVSAWFHPLSLCLKPEKLQVYSYAIQANVCTAIIKTILPSTTSSGHNPVITLTGVLFIKTAKDISC